MLGKLSYHEKYIYFDATKEEVNHYVLRCFDCEPANERLTILKTACRVGFDVNHVDGKDKKTGKGGRSVLQHAAHFDDVLSTCFLIKNGADVNLQTEDGETVLHTVAQSHAHKQKIPGVLRVIMSKSPDFEIEDDYGHTALSMACIKGFVEYIDILIDRGANVDIVAKCGCKCTLLKYIINHITENEDDTDVKNKIRKGEKHSSEEWQDIISARRHRQQDKFRIVLEKMISKKKEIYDVEIGLIKDLIEYDLFESVKIIIDRFPDTINRSPDNEGNTLFMFAIDENKNKFIEYFLSLNSLDVSIVNVKKLTYFHALALRSMHEYIKTIGNANSEIFHGLCSQGKNAIEYAVLGKSMRGDDEIINTLQLLVDMGLDINNRNNDGYRAIETAMKCKSSIIIEKFVKLGASIDGNRIGDNLDECNRSNDLLSYSAELGNIDTFKMFFGLNTPRHIYQSCPLHNLPICLMVAIKYIREDIILYLLNHDEIKQSLTEAKKRYLLAKLIKNGVMNIDIFKIVCTQEQISKINLNDKNTCDKLNEKYIREHVLDMDYDKNKIHVLKNLYTLISIINIVILGYGSRKVEVLTYCVNNLYDSIAPNIDFINELIKILSFKLGLADIQNLIINCIKLIKSNDDVYKHDSQKIQDEINELYFKYSKYIKVKDFNEFRESIKRLLAKYDKNEESSDSSDSNDSDIELDLNDLENADSSDSSNSSDTSQTVLNGENDQKTIQCINQNIGPSLDMTMYNLGRILFKLKWPVKVEHYDEIYSKLWRPTDVYIESSKGLTIQTNDNSIYFVPKIQALSKPTRWFKFYAPNIGRRDKADPNHMFPFTMDKMIYNCQCVEKTTDDPVHPGGIDTMLYFFGKMKIDNDEISGCYEYFINSYGTLFHRLFRPYENVPISIKKAFDGFI
jgi:ankyrin repeat protein